MIGALRKEANRERDRILLEQKKLGERTIKFASENDLEIRSVFTGLGFVAGIIKEDYGRVCLSCDSGLELVRYLGDGSDRAYFRCSGEGCRMWYDLPLSHEEKNKRYRESPLAR